MSALWIIPLLPFLGFLVNAFAGKRLGKNIVRAVACGALLFAFIASLMAAGKAAFTSARVPCRPARTAASSAERTRARPSTGGACR